METVLRCRRKVGEEAAAPRGSCAGERRAEILEQEWHACERPIRQARRNGLRGEVVELHHERIDGGVARFDTCNGGFQHLRRAHLARLHERRETQRIV